MTAQSRPGISIILPTFNRAHLLPEAIESVLSQTYQDWELIIVDDASTDDTARVVAYCRSGQDAIRLVCHAVRRGPGAARNTGVSEARGELLAFIDSDDLWRPHHLATMAQHLLANPHIDWIFGDSEILENGKIIVPSVFDRHWRADKFARVMHLGGVNILSEKHIFPRAIRFGLPAACQGSIIRRHVFDEIVFPESFSIGEDFLLILMAIRRRYHLAYTNDVHWSYRKHALTSSAHRTNADLRHDIAVYQKFKRLFKHIDYTLSVSSEDRSAIRRKISDLYFWQFAISVYLPLKKRRIAGRYFRAALQNNPLNAWFWAIFLLHCVNLEEACVGRAVIDLARKRFRQ